MARTIVLATGITAATSTDIIVAQGSTITVGIYQDVTGATDYPANLTFTIEQVTPGLTNTVTTLTRASRQVLIVGPGTFRVVRPATSGTAFGAFIES